MYGHRMVHCKKLIFFMLIRYPRLTMLHDKIQYGNFLKQYSSLTQLGETGEVVVVKFRVTQEKFLLQLVKLLTLTVDLNFSVISYLIFSSYIKKLAKFILNNIRNHLAKDSFLFQNYVMEKFVKKMLIVLTTTNACVSPITMAMEQSFVNVSISLFE